MDRLTDRARNDLKIVEGPEEVGISNVLNRSAVLRMANIILSFW